MFEPQHLQGASTELVQSMFKIGRTAAQLKQEKLQMKIQKGKSELRRKRLENRLKMLGKVRGKGGPAKNPKKTKQEPVISATMRPTVAIKIPEVDKMMARAQQKVEAIRQAKQKVRELKPIDEVVFAQNVPKYNLEWEHSPNGRATSYLATLVCCYMHELQQKDKKVVLSAKALKRFTTQQVARLENSSQANSILADMHWNKYVRK